MRGKNNETRRVCVGALYSKSEFHCNFAAQLVSQAWLRYCCKVSGDLQLAEVKKIHMVGYIVSMRSLLQCHRRALLAPLCRSCRRFTLPIFAATNWSSLSPITHSTSTHTHHTHHTHVSLSRLFARSLSLASLSCTPILCFSLGVSG